MMMKNYRKAKIQAAIIACLVTALFSACVSLQKDVDIASPQEQTDSDLSNLERAVVALESMGGVEARNHEEEMSRARSMISRMEKNAAAGVDYTARVNAWSGRLAILEGRYSEARHLYRQSLISSPWNIAAAILGIRLEGDPETRLDLIERELVLADPKSPLSGYGELQIEKARALLELRRFTESSGAFDTAFALAGLDGVYRVSYQSERNTAWELRGAEGALGSLEILERGGLSWKSCIALAKNETELLRFISAGRNISEAELFTVLVDRAFIPYTQDIAAGEWPREKPLPDDIVLRSGAAWFIWRLYAQTRADRGLLSRYSTRYAARENQRSPIADLPLLSPFFDSILGCVETEFLSLSDGRNFLPAEPARAAELLSVLKKIDN